MIKHCVSQVQALLNSKSDAATTLMAKHGMMICVNRMTLKHWRLYPCSRPMYGHTGGQFQMAVLQRPPHCTLWCSGPHCAMT